MCGWLGGWLGQWLGSGQMTKNLINLERIEIIQFCFEDLGFVETPTPMGGVCGWLGGSVGQWVVSSQMTIN